jgi:hypothetical protein
LFFCQQKRSRNRKRASGMAQVVKHLPSNSEPQSSNTRTAKKKKKLETERGYCNVGCVSQSSSVMDTWKIFVQAGGQDCS